MKKILFPVFALILIACSPQVTATSEVTITLTPTIIPTQTPQPPSPAFLDLQEEIAKSDIYTLTPTGLEMENADGTITLIPDILPNPQDGTFTITYEDNEYLVEFVSLDGQILTFKDEDGNTFVFNGENLVKTLTQEQLDQMTDEEKLAKAPETIADLTKSNISTVKNNLVIYRDSETNAQKVFDLLTGKELTLPEAGIIEIPLTTGENWELLYFETPEKSFNYIVDDVGTIWNDKYLFNNDNFSSEANSSQIKKLFKISNIGKEHIGGVYLPNGISDELDKFAVMLYSIDSGTIIGFMDKNKNFICLFIEINTNELNNLIETGNIQIPTKP